MKVFFDLNIIIDIIDTDRANNQKAVALMQNLMRNGTDIVISEDSISTLYYNLRHSKQKQLILLDFLEVITQKWQLASFGVETIKKAIKYSKILTPTWKMHCNTFVQIKKAAKLYTRVIKTFQKLLLL